MIEDKVLPTKAADDMLRTDLPCSLVFVDEALRS